MGPRLRAAPAGAEGVTGEGGGAGEREPGPEDLALFDKLAQWLARRRLATVAVLFLESVKPLTFVGSQAMYFFEPVVKAFLRGDEYSRFARLMEDRDNMERFLQRIEAAEEAQREREREEKRRRKQDQAGPPKPPGRNAV